MGVAPGNIKALLRKAEALKQLGQVADALLVSSRAAAAPCPCNCAL